MINVTKILAKNKWSGKDVGMLKIANKTDFKRRANKGDYSTDPLILPGDLNYMASTLSEKEKKEEVLQEGFDPCFAFILGIKNNIIRYSIAFPVGRTLIFNKEDSYTDKRKNFFLLFRELIGCEEHYHVKLIG